MFTIDSTIIIILIITYSISITIGQAQLQQQPNRTQQCYQCASTELKSRWLLTGLIQPDNMEFSNGCEWNPTMEVACSGPCFTYLFQDPDYLSRK